MTRSVVAPYWSDTYSEHANAPFNKFLSHTTITQVRLLLCSFDALIATNVLLMYHSISAFTCIMNKPWQTANRVDGLLAIERSLRSLLDARLRPVGITYAQFAILRFIDTPKNHFGYDIQHPIRPKEIADHFQFAPRTVTESVNELVDSDLVVRAKNPEDKRSVVLSVSAKGQEAIAKAKRIVQKAEGDVFSPMPRTQGDMLWSAIPNLRRSIAATRKLDDNKRKRACME